MQGSGPLSKEQAYAIHGIPPEVITPAIEREFQWFTDPEDRRIIYERMVTCDGQPVEIKRFNQKGWWHRLIGGIGTMRGALTLTSSAGTKTVYIREQMCVPGFPLIWLYWQVREKAYLVDESKEIAQCSQYGLGLDGVLAGYITTVNPDGLWKLILQDYTHAVRTQGGLSKYKVARGWYLLCGCLAGGRVNHRYYLQVLWIPIPLWKATN